MTKPIKPRQQAQQELKKLRRAGLSPEMISVILATGKLNNKLFRPMRAE